MIFARIKQLDHRIVHLASRPPHRQPGRTDPGIERTVPRLVHKLIEIVSEGYDFAIVGTEEGGAHVDELCEELFEACSSRLNLRFRSLCPSKQSNIISYCEFVSQEEGGGGGRDLRIADSLVKS